VSQRTASSQSVDPAGDSKGDGEAATGTVDSLMGR
jgi:hypothetical protein